MATTSGPATTPRSTAPARTSGASVPSTSTPPAVPTVPPPSALTTGSSWGPCCPRPAVPPSSCPSPGGCTSAGRNSRRPRRGRPSPSVPSARCWWSWADNTPTPARTRPWRLRRRLRPPQRGAAVGPSRRARRATRGCLDPPAAGRPAARLAATDASARPAGGDSEVGQAPAAAASGRPLARRLAGGPSLPVRPRPRGAVQGGGVLVARAGTRRARQGGRRRGGRLSPALHPGQQRHRTERPADGGGLRRPLPAGGCLPRPQAAAGLGGVPGLDASAHRADDAGAAGDDDRPAVAAVGVAAATRGRLVVAPAVESAQEPAERAGCRTAVVAASGRYSAWSGGLAGPREKDRTVRTATDSYVTGERAFVGQKIGPTTRNGPARRRVAGDGLDRGTGMRNTWLSQELTD